VSADLFVENHGSIVLMRPQTEAGRAWIQEAISREGYQPYWPTVLAEPRYVGDILEGAIGSGLDIEVVRR